MLLSGCTPVMVVDLEDCSITTTTKGDAMTEQWQCSGEPLTDDDLYEITHHGEIKR